MRTERIVEGPDHPMRKNAAGARRSLKRAAVLLGAGMLLAGLAAAGRAARGDSPAPAQPETTPASSLVWRHPVDWYPTQVRRWFESLAPELEYSIVRIRAGDDPRWAQTDWDDRAWPQLGVWDLPARSGIDWVRFRVRMNGARELPAGVMVSSVRAYEVYWDGVKLGNNGTPGNSATAEIPGRVDEWFSIPTHLLGSGEHVVAMRTSSHRCGFPASKSGFRFLVDEPSILRGQVLREAFLPTLAAGALCMTGLACGIMWLLAARRPTLMLLGGLCLTGSSMQAMQAVRWFFAYPADWHYPVLTGMTALVGLQGVLTVGFVIVHFELPRRRWLLGGLVPLFAFLNWWSPERQNLTGVYILQAALAVSVACVGWAAWRRRRGAYPALVGVSLSCVLLLLESEDYRASFFVRFLPALVGLIAALALQLHDERRTAREAKLTAARMEIELLKKNLQPHFLLNTLTAVSEVIEHDPRGAVDFIDDLAAVFRSLAQMSGERLVPLARELELCRMHLKVVGRRTGRELGLSVEGVSPDVLVPPALFLTLIENGLVRQQADTGVAFRLASQPAGEGQRFVFRSLGRTRECSSRVPGGTGLRYVKARLEESFPGRWSFAHGAVADGWETIIGWTPRPGAGGAA